MVVVTPVVAQATEGSRVTPVGRVAVAHWLVAWLNVVRAAVPVTPVPVPVSPVEMQLSTPTPGQATPSSVELEDGYEVLTRLPWSNAVVSLETAPTDTVAVPE